MARELVWLEDGYFSAWGCKACGWILVSHPPKVKGMPSAMAKEAFDGHDCTKFPQLPPKKPDRRSQ